MGIGTAAAAPIYPTGCTKAVTNVQPKSTADRLRLPILLPSSLWPAGPGREGRTDGILPPPPPPCGRKCGTEEGRQAAGPLPAGSAFV